MRKERSEEIYGSFIDPIQLEDTHTKMSTTIIAVFVNLVITFLPLMGIEIGSEAMETTVQTITAVVTGIWIWTQRTKQGDVNALGFKK